MQSENYIKVFHVELLSNALSEKEIPKRYVLRKKKRR
jgi:hypothetical protein